ncbi:MAG TPA: type II toxin-antitoxin system RelE/ParE family toxin [Terriglobia bacterium]|nr:type II toxin-antitoxin system RelE/ParE family toxin [Terriglobia bacterium]
MSLPVVVRYLAKAEIQSAYRWYEREREGLGEELLQAVDRVLGVIAEYPEGFSVVHRDIRRAILKRFPYSILYRVKANHVIVVGCFHAKRDPKSWQARR